MIRSSAHKQILGHRIVSAFEPDEPSVDEIDFDSDEPLACPLDREEGQPCESCQ